MTRSASPLPSGVFRWNAHASEKHASSGWTNPDDAPELTDDMLAEAEVFKGDRFVRRGGEAMNRRSVASFPAALTGSRHARRAIRHSLTVPRLCRLRQSKLKRKCTQITGITQNGPLGRRQSRPMMPTRYNPICVCPFLSAFICVSTYWAAAAQNWQHDSRMYQSIERGTANLVPDAGAVCSQRPAPR